MKRRAASKEKKTDSKPESTPSVRPLRSKDWIIRLSGENEPPQYFGFSGDCLLVVRTRKDAEAIVRIVMKKYPKATVVKAADQKDLAAFVDTLDVCPASADEFRSHIKKPIQSSTPESRIAA